MPLCAGLGSGVAGPGAPLSAPRAWPSHPETCQGWTWQPGPGSPGPSPAPAGSRGLISQPSDFHGLPWASSSTGPSPHPCSARLLLPFIQDLGSSMQTPAAGGLEVVHSDTHTCTRNRGPDREVNSDRKGHGACVPLPGKSCVKLSGGFLAFSQRLVPRPVPHSTRGWRADGPPQPWPPPYPGAWSWLAVCPSAPES